MGKLILDEAGYNAYLKDIQKIEEKLEALRKFKGEVAIYEGDAWHDNFTFEQAEAEERALMGEIAKRRQLLAEAEIVETGVSHGVELNDIVDVAIINGIKRMDMRLKLVSFLSSEPSELKEVTLSSPIGQAIYEKEVGDEFSYYVGEREMSGVITEISKENNISQSRTKVL